MIAPPILLIRRKHILRRLIASGAVTPDTACTFADAGVINPIAFPAVKKRLIAGGVIGETQDGRYWVL